MNAQKSDRIDHAAVSRAMPAADRASIAASCPRVDKQLEAIEACCEVIEILAADLSPLGQMDLAAIRSLAKGLNRRLCKVNNKR